jgi:hypothetical protein
MAARFLDAWSATAYHERMSELSNRIETLQRRINEIAVRL